MQRPHKIEKKTKDEPQPEPDAWDRFKAAIHKIAPPKKAKEKSESAE